MVCSFYTLVKLDWLSHGVFILHAGETRLAEPWCVHSTRWWNSTGWAMVCSFYTLVKLDWLSHGVFILHAGETRLAEPWCVHSTRWWNSTGWAMVCSFYTLVKLDWLSHGVFILHARLAEPWCVHSTRSAEPWCVHSTRWWNSTGWAMVCSFYTLVKLDWLSHGVFILHAGETRLAEPWCVHSTRWWNSTGWAMVCSFYTLVKLDWLSHGLFCWWNSTGWAMVCSFYTLVKLDWLSHGVFILHVYSGETRLAEPWCVHSTRWWNSIGHCKRIAWYPGIILILVGNACKAIFFDLVCHCRRSRQFLLCFNKILHRNGNLFNPDESTFVVYKIYA